MAKHDVDFSISKANKPWRTLLQLLRQDFSRSDGLGHKEWRKFAKKYRRKRVRSMMAIKRDKLLDDEQKAREMSPSHLEWMAEQESLEAFAEMEEKRQAAERIREWEEEEEAAQIRWRQRNARLALASAEKARQELLIKEEWDREQTKLKQEEKRRKEEEDEKRKRQEKLLLQIEEFVSGSGHLPACIDVTTETQPGRQLCPFFSKVGACRFFDKCSRNHIRPGISTTLLFPGFYQHFTIQQTEHHEYDTDSALEIDDDEAYQNFVEFFHDVLPEFELCGQVVQLKVCSNMEPHLRGNVYVGFADSRHAMSAYRKFHGRFYAGRQLMPEFCNIPAWKNAICGLHYVKRCPKGRNCNFLHVFRNPNNEFRNADHDRYYHHPPSRKSRPRSRSRQDWRWSQSPEPCSIGRGRNADWESSERLSRSRDKSSSRHKNKKSHSTDRTKTRARSRPRKEKQKSDRKRNISQRSSHRRSVRNESGDEDRVVMKRYRTERTSRVNVDCSQKRAVTRDKSVSSSEVSAIKVVNEMENEMQYARPVINEKMISDKTEPDVSSRDEISVVRQCKVDRLEAVSDSQESDDESLELLRAEALRSMKRGKQVAV